MDPRGGLTCLRGRELGRSSTARGAVLPECSRNHATERPSTSRWIQDRTHPRCRKFCFPPPPLLLPLLHCSGSPQRLHHPDLLQQQTAPEAAARPAERPSAGCEAGIRTDGRVVDGAPATLDAVSPPYSRDARRQRLNLPRRCISSQLPWHTIGKGCLPALAKRTAPLWLRRPLPS